MLVDAKGVNNLYRPVVKGRDIVLFAVAMLSSLVLVVAVIDRVGHLVRQPLGLPGALSRQRPRHGLQQQAEQQEPGGKDGFHSG